AAGRDGSVRVWDVASGVEVERFVLRTPVVSLAALPDGRRVLAGCLDSTVRLLRMPGPEVRDHPAEVWRVPCGGSHRFCSRFSPDGTMFLCNGDDNSQPWRFGGVSDGKIRLWDLAAGQELVALDAHPKDCRVAFTPDGKRLLSWSPADGKYRLWDVAARKPLGEFAAEADRTDVAGFLPDGTF